MKKYIFMAFIIFLVSFVFFHVFVCDSQNAVNKVPLNQINPDNSNDYRYIFKDLIEKEQWKKRRYEKDPFE